MPIREDPIPVNRTGRQNEVQKKLQSNKELGEKTNQSFWWRYPKPERRLSKSNGRKVTWRKTDVAENKIR